MQWCMKTSPTTFFRQYIPEVLAASARAAAASLAAAGAVADDNVAAPAGSLSAASAAATPAAALTETGVEAAAELVAEPGDFFLGVAAAKRSESSSRRGSAWSSMEFSEGDMLMADGLMRGDLQACFTVKAVSSCCVCPV